MEKWVIKVGSGVIEGESNKPDHRTIENLANEIKKGVEMGKSIILVSSGAMLLGMVETGTKKVPKDISKKQALCSIGQPKLVELWGKYLSPLKPAQILLTHDDFSSKERSKNTKNTVEEILRMGFIPIVNENDTVATDEIKLGDNDFLSVFLSALLDADKLVIITDVDGIIDIHGKVISEIDFSEIEKKKIDMWGEIPFQSIGRILRATKKKVGAGGISSKISAVKLASEFGIDSYIINGKKRGSLSSLFEGKNSGTHIIPRKKEQKKKLWIGNILKGKGTVEIDKGAWEALKKGKSLLPSGIKKVIGNFSRGDMVEISVSGKTVAKGISNYFATEINLIKGKKTREIEKILGYKREDEVIHRDNMYFLD